MTVMTKDETLTLADIRAAHDRIQGHVVRTPMRYAPHLTRLTEAEVWVKYENLQYTSSFKERGAYNTLCQLSDAEKARGVIAMSAGNHAQGVAYHAMRLGIPATIVMPVHAPIVKVEQTRSYGARVVLHGETVDAAKQKAMEIQQADNLVFLHPFDQLTVMAGQGTVALEMLEEHPDLDDLIIPIGGGGLISGNAIAAKAITPDIRITGVEAALYPSFKAARAGIDAPCGGATLAEGIAVKAVGQLPLKLAGHLIDEIIEVEEGFIEQAICHYANYERTVAEGAGATPLAAMLKAPERFKGRKIGLILCGGNIDTRILSEVLMRGMERDGRLAVFRISGEDRPGVLAKITGIIGEMGGNIQHVVHDRLELDLPVKCVEYEFSIETRGPEHSQEILNALLAAGFQNRT